MHGVGKLLCLRREAKAGAMFLFEQAQDAKGKNREARPGRKFRQEFYRRGLPAGRTFLKYKL